MVVEVKCFALIFRFLFFLEVCPPRGIKTSSSKTEFMCVNERNPSERLRLQVEECRKKVEDLKDLESTVQRNGECECMQSGEK